MKILFITNIPSPYRVDFFNELGQYCDLTVLFEKNTSSDRHTSWSKQNFLHFKGIILNGKDLKPDTALCFDIFKYIKKDEYNHIILGNPLTSTGMMAIEFMRIKKIDFLIESDGGFAKSGKGMKEMLKRHIISGAKAWFSTADDHDDYYITYGANKENIYRYPFTSVYQKDILEKVITDDEKLALRDELGIMEEKVILSVGQFIHRKGFDVLLKACVNLGSNVGIYIVGGQPTQEYMEICDELALRNIHFLDFMPKDELIKYYRAVDLFVLPTREDIWGLVINEAMAQGLPVVTTDKCLAGTALVEDNYNGYIVPVNNVKILADSLRTILKDEKVAKVMSENSLAKIQKYTIEEMARAHMDIFGGL